MGIALAPTDTSVFGPACLAPGASSRSPFSTSGASSGGNHLFGRAEAVPALRFAGRGHVANAVHSGTRSGRLLCSL